MRHGNIVGALTSSMPIGHISWNFGKIKNKKMLVIPSSIAICERRFSKQNESKSHLQALFEVGHFGWFDESINMGIEVANMDRRVVFELWCNMRNRITLLINIAPQNITVKCWAFNLNMSLPTQLFKHLIYYILRTHITRSTRWVLLCGQFLVWT